MKLHWLPPDGWVSRYWYHRLEMSACGRHGLEMSEDIREATCDTCINLQKLYESLQDLYDSPPAPGVGFLDGAETRKERGVASQRKR